jgi:hypothetical protein
MTQPLDSRLLARLRDLLDERPATEAELRSLAEDADGWERSLRAQVEASERRLEALVADPESSLADLARELRRVVLLHPALTDARELLERLETRARELRTAWLLGQASAANPLSMDAHNPARAAGRTPR